ncbi:hypothetical protein PSTG_09491 [Puccinia striiformis f. sp. tritici PST-78]|uniref:Uncharacterized protein n=1 Tax=Puccinia striiformis f. sp. tritici PST-78 TaxID=1165861 RepID=A0A0L0VE12_9BASI|nr:hypothetical protein PSTG_09491 [Puccinia striiformis f. sp. tritici PST-78]
MSAKRSDSPVQANGPVLGRLSLSTCWTARTGRSKDSLDQRVQAQVIKKWTATQWGELIKVGLPRTRATHLYAMHALKGATVTFVTLAHHAGCWRHRSQWCQSEHWWGVAPFRDPIALCHAVPRAPRPGCSVDPTVSGST